MKKCSIAFVVLLVCSSFNFLYAQCTFIEDSLIHETSWQQALDIVKNNIKSDRSLRKTVKDYHVVPLFMVAVDTLHKEDFAGNKLSAPLKYVYTKVENEKTPIIRFEALIVDNTGKLVALSDWVNVKSLANTPACEITHLQQLADSLKSGKIQCAFHLANLNATNLFEVSKDGTVKVYDRTASCTVYNLDEYIEKRW